MGGSRIVRRSGVAATPWARASAGELVLKEPWIERRVVDFGPGVGEKECYLLDNPDVPTVAEALGARQCGMH